ncbi:MAG: NosD domain-containing protein [Sphingopyxis sp.]
MRRKFETAAILGMAAAATIATGGVAWALQTSRAPTASDLIANARPGQNITLPAGTTGGLTISNRNFSPAITIDAAFAALTSIIIRNSSGITIEHGTVTGPGGRSYGIHIDRSRNIRIANMVVTGAHRGIVMGKSQDIAIVSNNLTGLLAEGINIAQSQRVLIERNQCSNFSPAGATYSADGARILADGDHADCIQAWSRPDFAPTSDVRVIGNRITGRMQGIFFGNHERGGVNDGGYDRIVIANNAVTVTMPHGIALYEARDGQVTNNRIATVPGSTSPRPPYNRITAMLRIVDSLRVTACGNVVSGARGDVVGTQPCAGRPPV